MSTVAEEVAALRGTRSATFRDLLTHRAFARLLAAMSVSSFGDWVGFVAVTAIVANIGGTTASLAVAGVMLARTLPAFVFGPITGTLVDRLSRKQIMIVADIGRGVPVPLDGLPAGALGDLPPVVRDRMPVPAVDPGARRIVAQPRASAAAGERELPGAAERVRDAAARRRGLRRADGDLDLAGRAYPAAAGAARVPRADPRRRDVRVLRGDGGGDRAARPAEPDRRRDLGYRRSGTTRSTASASSGRTRSPPR